MKLSGGGHTLCGDDGMDDWMTDEMDLSFLAAGGVLWSEGSLQGLVLCPGGLAVSA